MCVWKTWNNVWIAAELISTGTSMNWACSDKSHLPSNKKEQKKGKRHHSLVQIHTSSLVSPLELCLWQLESKKKYINKQSDATFLEDSLWFPVSFQLPCTDFTAPNKTVWDKLVKATAGREGNFRAGVQHTPFEKSQYQSTKASWPLSPLLSKQLYRQWRQEKATRSQGSNNNYYCCHHH